MSYQNIFWLEDTPDILGEILRICSGQGIDKDSLFSKTTFASDYEVGAQIAPNEEFDLYILDADFPQSTSEEWKKNYRDFLQQVSLETRYLDFKKKYGEGYIGKRGKSTNNFSLFFSEFLPEKSGKIVIYSVSTIAPTIAFHHGLPFYSKALNKDTIKEIVGSEMNNQRFFKRYFPSDFSPKKADFLDQWECGSRFELVERYLI